MAEKSSGGVNALRAIFGQGLGMGWGDEAEAWLREKLKGEDYEKALAKIRSEYGEYSKENPYISGSLEFAGGVVPGVAAMFVPGGQAVGAQQLARTTGGTLARLAARPSVRLAVTGGTTGAVTGAGTATEGQRGSGAATGAALGTTLGVATPMAMRTGKSGYDWLRERLMPSDAMVQNKALGKMTSAMQEAGLTPQDIAKRKAEDVKLGVPSVVANVDPSLADLAQTVAQRTGKGTRVVEKRLGEQKAGARERTYQQVSKGLKPGDYYADMTKMTKELRDQADDLYEKAYAYGTVDDPRINEVLKNPSFAGFYEKAKEIANTQALAAKLEGRDPSRYQLKEIYTFDTTPDGKLVPVLKEAPDVRTLDYIKQGIDATIESNFKSGKPKEAIALKDLRRVFVNSIDENVDDYRIARKEFAGDMEVIEAMQAGMEKFGKLDHEQVIDLVSKMSNAEKSAFRTGVARDMYSRIMDPSGNFNAAQKIIGAPEMQAKLQPLFDDPKQFKLFKAALEREAQLFHQANSILGGSQTGKRMLMAKEFEEESGVGQALAQAVTGGFWSSLTGLTARAIQSGKMTPDVADKLAPMLMSKNPKEVAAVVQLLEDYAKEMAPKAARATRLEGGATTGTTVGVFPPMAAPATEEELDIEKTDINIPGLDIESGPDIEVDISAESKKQR